MNLQPTVSNYSAPGSVAAHQNAQTLPSEITLMIPDDDVIDPELSIVIPALNEEITISQFVEWCKQGIANAGISAEILIIDSSSDRTADIAVAHGARVLKCPKRGLGRAYIDAIPHIRGRYVLMGDADCTYDFREIRPFVKAFREGFEFVMGSRFRGSIASGAMPALHRYFGTPLTTWILNVMYRTRFTDIHCGMRGVTRDGLIRMELASQSWEYASEMVLKSVHLGLLSTEVPVHFLKDPEGRLSHHARSGWLSPWRAGWINLRAMFVFGADFFLLVPGGVLLALGFPLLFVLAFGPLSVSGVTLSLNTMVASLFATLVGLQLLCMGIVAQCIYDRTGRKRARWFSLLRYNPVVLTSLGVITLGLGLAASFILAFAHAGYRVPQTILLLNHRAILGVFLMISGVQLFVTMLVVQALRIYLPDAAPSSGDGRRAA